MRRSDSVDFVFQLASLVVALIIVHAFYVTVVRPRADVFSAEQAALMAADSDYVQQRSVWVIVRDFEQEACFVLMLWAMAIMASKGLTTARESQLLEADLVPVPAYPPGPPFFPSNYCHSPQELRIIVRNIGPGPAGPTTTRVEFYEDGVVVDVPTEALDPAGGAKDETLLSVQIPPGCLSAQPFEQDEECLFRITVNANPADGVEESDTTNNMDSGNCVILL